MNNSASALKSMLYRFLDNLSEEGLQASAIVDVVALYVRERGESDAALNSLEDAASYLQKSELRAEDDCNV